MGRLATGFFLIQPENVPKWFKLINLGCQVFNQQMFAMVYIRLHIHIWLYHGK